MPTLSGPTTGALGLIDGFPLVAPIEVETAALLKVSLPELRRAADCVRVWGERADGVAVFRVRELRAALGQPDFRGGSRGIALR